MTAYLILPVIGTLLSLAATVLSVFRSRLQNAEVGRAKGATAGRLRILSHDEVNRELDTALRPDLIGVRRPVPRYTDAEIASVVRFSRRAVARCPECGDDRKPAARYCRKCGAALSSISNPSCSAAS